MDKVKRFILEVGRWGEDRDQWNKPINPNDKWGDKKDNEIIKDYLKISKQLNKENKNVIWISGRYTKLLEAANNNDLFYWIIYLDISCKNVILEDDAGNVFNYYFIGRPL